MTETQSRAQHTIKSHGTKVLTVHKHDWLILLLLVLIDFGLNMIEPFHRFVGEEMMTDLKYPFKEDTVPFWAVPIYAVLLPCVIFMVYYLHRRDIYDLHHAILGLLFSVLVTGVITDSIKDAVGRPRPNFFWRCFPDGKGVFDPITKNVMCHGLKKIIKEGHKSFPSGHTSWSFAGLGFLAWYLSGKIKVFDRRGHIAKLCIVLVPYLFAALIGVSRVDDYWHHWTDVFAGGLLGTVVSSLCYLQFFPFPHDMNGWAPHAYFRMLAENVVQPSTAEMETVYGRHEYVKEAGQSSSQDLTPDLEAMGTLKNH
ncbi:lipid phosphate phosphatase 2-like [Cornus florida]|uniref:lipid phosphate phosphatase 2-like n=1 Tax=Cornus florida TaxID=4283 RepID=UPI00289EE6E2|nr:lipid phosphate phosphatase 2-like [Cornus florida]